MERLPEQLCGWNGLDCGGEYRAVKLQKRGQNEKETDDRIFGGRNDLSAAACRLRRG